MPRSFGVTLVGVVVLGLLVGAGAAYLNHRPTATPQVAAAAAPDKTFIQTGGGPGGQGGGQSGTVESVTTDKLTIRTPSGTSTVDLNDQMVVQRQEKASPADLKVGDNVAGRGEPDAQGVVKVSMLQILPAGQRGAGAVVFQGTPGAGGQGRQGGQQAQGAQGGQGGQGRQGGGQGNFGGGGGGQRGGAVFGTIAKVDGATLTLTGPGGQPETATLAPDAELRRIVPATRDDLKPGAQVAVAGRTITIIA